MLGVPLEVGPIGFLGLLHVSHFVLPVVPAASLQHLRLFPHDRSDQTRVQVRPFLFLASFPFLARTILNFLLFLLLFHPFALLLLLFALFLQGLRINLYLLTISLRTFILIGDILAYWFPSTVNDRPLVSLLDISPPGRLTPHNRPEVPTFNKDVAVIVQNVEEAMYMGNVIVNNLVSSDAVHVDFELIGEQIDELLQPKGGRLILILCNFDDLDAEICEDAMADIEIGVGITEDLLILEVAWVASIEGDVLHHLHQLGQYPLLRQLLRHYIYNQ